MKREELRKLRQWQDRLETAKEAIQPELDGWGSGRVSTTAIPPSTGRTVPKQKRAGPATCGTWPLSWWRRRWRSDIPTPKVTAIRQEDEHLADVVENLLRNVIDKLPFERLNDEGERISPVQGGTDCWWTGRTASAARTGWATCG